MCLDILIINYASGVGEESVLLVLYLLYFYESVFSFLEIEIFFAIIYNRITYNWIIYRDVEWLENGTLIVDIWRMKLKSLRTAELLNLSFERCV